MVQDHELVMLIFGAGVLLFTLKNLSNLKKVPAFKFLLGGFYVLFAALLLTVLEGFFLNNFFNFLEHICYAGSSILIAIWCWCLCRGNGG